MRYVFWDGGYTSTYRILYSILIDKIKVRPIYINQNEKSRETLDKINLCIKKINKEFPKGCHMVLPIWIINDLVITPETHSLVKNVFNDYLLFISDDKIEDFTNLLQFSINYNVIAEISYLNSNALFGALNGFMNKQMNLGSENNFNSKFPSLQFPLFYKKKEDLNKVKTKNQWDKVFIRN